ncbi:hypothetical protein V8F33_011028 [Rhypophila sp. PSN 637]
MVQVNEPSDPYGLNRDHLAAIRLNLQNYLWGDSLGYTIHPDIKEDQGLELGIGKETGAKSNIQLDGFDIDIVQCPQPEWLPDNIKFHTWNAFEEPESDMVGQYDLVHVRLFGINVKNPEHGVEVISNLKKLLKPGGWIQWEEVRSSASKVHKINPSVQAPATDGLLEFVLRESRKYRGGDEVKASRRSASGTITTRPCCGGTSTRSGCSPSQSSLEPQLRGTEAGAKYSAMVMNACEEARQGAVIKLGRLALMAKLA